MEPGMLKCKCGRELPADMFADISKLPEPLKEAWGFHGYGDKACGDCYFGAVRFRGVHPEDFYTAVGKTPAQVQEIVTKLRARGHLPDNMPARGPLVKRGVI